MVWANAEHSVIDCVVEFEKFGDTPFAANPLDTHSHSKEIFKRAKSGEFGPIKEYVEPIILITEEIIRSQRNSILLEIDQLSPVYWAAVSPSKKDEWIKYRQDLLDITLQPGFPENVVWPIKPER